MHFCTFKFTQIYNISFIYIYIYIYVYTHTHICNPTSAISSDIPLCLLSSFPLNQFRTELLFIYTTFTFSQGFSLKNEQWKDFFIFIIS